VPPFDTATARSIVQRELAVPVEESFAHFDQTPLASGSIGQVHRARTHDGVNVVVKIKRPDIDRVVGLDMHILNWFADAAERLAPELRAYRPVQLANEFSETLRRELDFLNEASATARMSEAFRDDPNVRVPEVRWELCGSQMITLEQIKGTNLDTLLAAGGERLDRKALARHLANAYLKQFFEVGVFQADPHAGNILVTPPATVGLIDFGQVGTLSDELATQFLVLLLAAVNREPELIVDVLDDLGGVGPDTDRQQLERSLRLLLDKYYGLPLRRFDLVSLFSELNNVIRENDVSVPRSLVILIKALTTVSGVAMRLDPELDLVALLKPRMSQLIAKRLAPTRLAKSLGIGLWQTVTLLRSAPRQIQAALRHLSRGGWQLQVQHENLDRLTTELDRSSNRLAFSIVIAAVIVGSSMLVGTEGQVPILGLSLRALGILGFLIAALLGLGLVWAIFRSGRLH
jgi:ubiquinone biosynthesis protein